MGLSSPTGVELPCVLFEGRLDGGMHREKDVHGNGSACRGSRRGQGGAQVLGRTVQRPLECDGASLGVEGAERFALGPGTGSAGAGDVAAGQALFRTLDFVPGA